jgi:hypothetical protein
MQDPTRMRGGRNNAVNYKNVGVNTFVGLWEFPTDSAQYAGWSVKAMQTLKDNGLRALAGRDPSWVKAHPEFSGTLLGYALGDEPDMNKVNGDARDQPDNWKAAGDAIAAADPAHERYANFGKGLCLDPWVGYHGDEAVDFPKYVEPETIVSCDYYAVTDPYEALNQHGVWGYGRGVEGMKRWAAGRPVWGFVEASAPFREGKQSNNIAGRMPPSLIDPSVWMMVIHGADGVEYFCHDFLSGFVEDGCLNDPGMPDAMRATNAMVQKYAGVLQAPDAAGTTATSSGSVPVTTLTKRVGTSTYVFAIGDGNSGAPNGQAVSSTISVAGAGEGTVEVLDENRTLTLAGGKFTDNFDPYQHHIYRITGT